MLALNAQKTALTSHSAAAKQLKTLTSSPGFVAPSQQTDAASKCAANQTGNFGVTDPLGLRQAVPS